MSRVVQELRRTRRVRRLGEQEWFEVAYRAYLVALVGGSAFLWASSFVEDLAATPARVADVATHGPAVLGLAFATAVAMGLRSGSDGGPVALEAADVQHLLLAPVPRRAVLMRPVGQRLRALAFGGAVLGGAAGYLAAERLPGSPAAWTTSGAAAGALVGLSFATAAVLAHAARLPRAVATTLAAIVLATQVAAAVGWLPAGPGDWVGHLALSGMGVEGVGAAAAMGAALVVLSATVAVALADRLRTEPLVRRAGLVSQLRFAATMQDLRTVVLLRRQLRGEHPRLRPLVRLANRSAPPGRTVWRRDWRGLARYPTARVVRMTALVAAAGAAIAVAVAGTTPMIVVAGVALHLFGLDALEPLSQEIDHPDHSDATPRPRGWLLVAHLAVPAIAVVPFALVGAAVVAAVEPGHAAAALALAVPVTWAGVSGSAISVVRDAPDPLAAPASAAVPPEFAGFTTTTRLLWPIAVSVAGAVPVLIVRETPTAGAALRGTVVAVLLAAFVAWWVRRRDEWRARWRNFLEEGRAAKRTAGARP